MTAEALCAAMLFVFGSDPSEARYVRDAYRTLACDHAQDIIDSAHAYNLDPTVLVGLIYEESRFNPKATSRSGACGWTQVIPKWARPEQVTCEELHSPDTSLLVGSYMLERWYLKRGKGSMRRALSCYNAGLKCLSSPSGRAYANRVLRLARRIKRHLSSHRAP